MSLELAVAVFLLSILAGIAGRKRRIGFWGFFFCSLLFTPLVSLLFLYFASPQKAPKSGTNIVKAPTPPADIVTIPVSPSTGSCDEPVNEKP